jgi:hypothetical protein
LQSLADVIGTPPPQLGKVRPIRYQTASDICRRTEEDINVRSPSPRRAAQSASSSSSPRGALVVARCRNCGA